MIDSDDDKVLNDFDYSRTVYRDLIEKGRQALEDAILVAQEEEHPRAFEVVGGMIKNLSDVNDKLLDLHKKHRGLEPKEEQKQIANQTHNTFIGSTTELQRMLQQIEDDKMVDVTPNETD